MRLSDPQRVRYARHLLLPELGEAGQLRLLSGHVRFAADADAGARAVAENYMLRAGVRVAPDEPASEFCSTDELLVALPRLASAPALIEAARALSGAFAAVEAIKSLAALGEPAELPRDVLSSTEES